jgi:mRNA interferase MazF
LKRGDVYTARLDPIEGSEQAGTRPAVIVSREIINSRRTYVIIVPITSYRGRPQAPSHVFLPRGLGGLANDSIALAEQVRLVSKTRLSRHWGSLPSTVMREVNDALRSALALDDPR